MLQIVRAKYNNFLRRWLVLEKPTRMPISMLYAGLKVAGQDISVEEAECLTDDLLDTFEATLGGTADGEEGGKQISMKRHVLIVKDGNGRSVDRVFFQFLN